MRYINALLAALAAFVVSSIGADAQTLTNRGPNFVVGCLYDPSPVIAQQYQALALVCDATTHGLNVNVVGGSSVGGTSSSFGAAFPLLGTAIGVKNGANMVNLTADASSNLNVNCATGCAGGTFNNNADAVATSAVNGQSASWLYGYNGATWDRLRVDGSKNLAVNCLVGCSGGTFNNNADAVATSATNGTNAAYLYGFNGATFDRLRVDGSKNLNVNIATATTVTANAGTNLNTSALALDTSVNGLLLSQASATAGQKGSLHQCAVTTAAPSYTTAQTDPLSCTPAGALRVDASATTQPVSGTVTTSPPANASTNVAQLAGTTTDTNSGNKSAGTLRVVIATDQPALTNALKVDPSAVTSPVSIAATVSENLAQIAGNTTSAGNGVSGTGVQRITIASDTTGVVQSKAESATGAAPPAMAIYQGANIGGNLTGLISCQSAAIYDASTTGSTQIVGLVSGKVVYICGYTIVAGGTVNVKLVYGTGSNCATGATNITPAFQLTAQAGAVDGSAYYRGLNAIASNELCINASGAVAVQAIVYYSQF